ncbi:MAG TPA: uroporphyrinogen-III synthase, partial [Nitrososphaerales archaeon]|nr:uroporphyrinogen-III synthase [Nitrososphaerales archaeon]
MREPSSPASRPLEGLTIVVTGSRRAPEQSALVTNLGGIPYVVPTVGISIPSDDSEIEPFLRELVGADGADYALFMTATGVRAMMMAAERLGLRQAVVDALNSRRTTVVARSGKPRGELAKTGIKVDASPPVDEATANGILKLLQASGLAGKRVAILWHGSRNPDLGEGILASGAKQVFECLTYHYSTSLEPEGAEVLRSIGFRYKAPEERTVVQ